MKLSHPTMQRAIADARATGKSAGVELGEAKPTVLHTRFGDRGERIVLMWSGNDGVGVVSKHILSPTDLGHFQTMVAAQENAHSRLSPADGIAAPQVLGFSDDDRVFLLAAIAGQGFEVALLDCLYDDPARAALFTRMGKWCAAFQDPNAHPKRGVWKKGIRNKLHDIEARVPQLAEPDLLKQAIDTVRGLTPAAGAETLSGWRHGDLHIGNVMISADTVTGYDFGPSKVATLGPDLARFWIEIVAQFYQEDALGVGQIAVGADMDAFVRGYGHDIRGDGGLRYYLGAAWVEQWAALPTQFSVAHWRKQHRAAGVILGARRFLGV
ncbi:MAG: phosphotransferase [Paracoccaceae bacterium]|nr:phosphotransferase [Paracoccaceae bacterium]